MIIKVPVYVDVDAIRQEDLLGYVSICTDRFYKSLRKQKLILPSSYTIGPKDKKTPVNAKLISKEMALETLRKGVK